MLQTFHYAGVSSKNVTLGVPRLKEILHVSTPPRTPGLTVYLQDHICDDQDSANLMHSRLECIVMGDIAILTEIHYDPDIRNSVVQKDIEFVRDYYGMSDESERYLSRLSRFVLRIELDRQLCYDKRIEMNSLVEQIQSEYGQDVNAIATDDNAENLIVRIRIVEDEQEENSMPMEEESLFEEHWVLLKRLEKVNYKHSVYCLHFCLLQCCQNYNSCVHPFLFILLYYKNMLSNLKLRGVDHVKKVFMKHDTKRTIWNDEIGFIMKKEWVLETEGSNLLPVLSMDYVDATRTISNDIVEVFMVFGIEGVRRALLNELRRVLGFDGCYINYRHLALLVDAMTMSGRIMSIDRHGINRAESAPLLRCSFEEAVMTLMDAGIYAEEEVLNGVTGNIMLGQLARIGTGDVDLLLNGQNVIRNAFEVIVEDNLDQNNDTGPPTPYATTPLSSFGTTEDVVDDVGAAFSPLYFPTRLESVGGLLTSPSYNPTSPNYSPTSPAPSVTSDSLTSPAYSPTSPAYSITSPSYSVTSPAYSASSPLYSVSSPTYSISRLLEQSSTSPTYLSSSPAYSPHRPPTPSSSPLSPIYSPISPAYSSRNS
jgi:DNA-directed RNA polymerase II subunit RPB1